MNLIKSKEDIHQSKKIIEKHLRNYTTYKVGIVTLKKQLDYIMPDVTASYELSAGSTGTFNIESKTEKFAIDRIESKRALVLHEDIRIYSLLVDSIDKAIANLDEVESEFVKYRYIDRNSVIQTAIKLNCSEKNVYNIRNQVLDELLISLKGLLHF